MSATQTDNKIPGTTTTNTLRKMPKWECLFSCSQLLGAIYRWGKALPKRGHWHFSWLCFRRWQFYIFNFRAMTRFQPSMTRGLSNVNCQQKTEMISKDLCPQTPSTCVYLPQWEGPFKINEPGATVNPSRYMPENLWDSSFWSYTSVRLIWCLVHRFMIYNSLDFFFFFSTYI